MFWTGLDWTGRRCSNTAVYLPQFTDDVVLLLASKEVSLFFRRHHSIPLANFLTRFETALLISNRP